MGPVASMAGIYSVEKTKIPFMYSSLNEDGDLVGIILVDKASTLKDEYHNMIEFLKQYKDDNPGAQVYVTIAEIKQAGEIIDPSQETSSNERI